MTALELLYRRHAPDVYRYAYGLLRNRADAEDAVQTTFLNAHRAFAQGMRPDDARPWLIRIARNVCREGFRRAARRPAEVCFQDEIPAAEPDGPSAEEIRLALSQLSLNQRAVLVMRELEGRKYSEIAASLGLSLGAVETLLFRARRALREQLEGDLGCEEAQHRALSGSADGALRAHLRVCSDCARTARRQRALRGAAKASLGIPLPGWLGSLFGGGAAVGAGVATKAAAVTAVGLLVAGGTYEAAHSSHPAPTRTARHAVRPASAGPAPVAIASRRGKELDDGHREQAQRGTRVAHLERGQARREEEGQGRGPERKPTEAEDRGKHGRSAGRSRGSAAVLEKAKALNRGRGLALGVKRAEPKPVRHSNPAHPAKAHGVVARPGALRALAKNGHAKEHASFRASTKIVALGGARRPSRRR